MATTSPAQGRIFSLDVIRGVAVMGIFSVNIIAFAMIEAAYFNPAADGGHHGIDLFVWAANMLVIDGKMRTLFSMLFGASALLVIDRAEAAGLSGEATHHRRMAVLLGIGLIHYYLIWFGDILVLYALAGMLVFFARRLPVRSLIAIGFVAMLVHCMFFSLFLTFQAGVDQAANAANASPDAIRDWHEGLGSFTPTAAELAEDRALHLAGLLPLVLHKLANTGNMVVSNLIFIPDTVALMLFGMAAYKSGFLTGDWDDRRYRLVAAILIPLGSAMFAGLVWADITSRFDIVTMMVGFIVVATPFMTLQALGYAALIILLTRKRGWLASRVAAAGRCAFTNYLGTSLVATFIFYGWGLGYYGSLSRAQAWLLVPCVWAVMLLWSKPWLEHFRYGPLEWIWRSLARGSLQPMRKAGPVVGV